MLFNCEPATRMAAIAPPVTISPFESVRSWALSSSYGSAKGLTAAGGLGKFPGDVLVAPIGEATAAEEGDLVNSARILE
jgi:hypothetical protein